MTLQDMPLEATHVDTATTPVARKTVLAVTQVLPDEVEARLQRDYQVTRLHALRGSLHERIRDAGNFDVLLCTPVDRVNDEVVSALPESVRLIATFSVGYNHIDLAAAQRRHITVTNTPDVLTDATADLAWLLLLGAARRASEGERLMREGGWTGWQPTQLLGIQVSGKRLGIVGMGRIGRAVAQRALGFGMQVHYLSAARKDDLDPQRVVHHAQEETFWPQCQFLSLHLPATPQTRHFLNASRLAKLPAGAVVVNTARGDVVDDDALIAALRSGQVAAAGLDVFTNEPQFRREYAELSNTFLLPHLGSATTETRCAMGYRALDNVDAFVAGARPRDVVV